MSIEQKAGQVLIVGGYGNASGPSYETKRNITELQVGGIFLIPGIGVQMKPADTATLITEMQRLALDNYGIPLFISLDQEGGHASALNSLNGGTDTPLLPFQRAIENGADAMMTGHIIYTAIDPEYPASMSTILLRGILRTELGYEGLIVTDSIGMQGAIIGTNGEDPTVRALIAGNDMVLQAGTEYSGASDKIANITTAVKNGRISEADLDSAVRRILAFKMKYCAFEQPFPDLRSVPDSVETQENIARAQNVADHTIVLYRPTKGVLPLSSKQKILFIGPDIICNDPGSGWTNIVDRTMGDVLDTFSQKVVRYEVSLPPPIESVNEYIPLVEDADVIIIATINAHYSVEQREFFAPLFSATDKPIILLTLGVPYDSWDFPDAGTIFNVTGQRSVSLIAAAKVLFG